jgi:hypothetical protein
MEVSERQKSDPQRIETLILGLEGRGSSRNLALLAFGSNGTRQSSESSINLGSLGDFRYATSGKAP